MTDRVDAEAIAAGLSEGARRIMTGGAGQIKHLCELVDAECCVDELDDDNRAPFTPLGLAVRDVLMKEKG